MYSVELWPVAYWIDAWLKERRQYFKKEQPLNP